MVVLGKNGNLGRIGELLEKVKLLRKKRSLGDPVVALGAMWVNGVVSYGRNPHGHVVSKRSPRGLALVGDTHVICGRFPCERAPTGDAHTAMHVLFPARPRWVSPEETWAQNFSSFIFIYF